MKENYMMNFQSPNHSSMAINNKSLSNSTSVSKLCSIMKQKNTYLEDLKHKKYQHRIQKLKKNYTLYLSQYEKIQHVLRATDSICTYVELIHAKYKRSAFNNLKQIVECPLKLSQTFNNHSANQQQNGSKSQKQNIKPKIKQLICRLFSNTISQMFEQNKQYLLNNSFSSLKQYVRQDKSGKINANEGNIQNMRILQFQDKFKSQYKLQLEENSIDCHMLDLSVFQSKQNCITEKLLKEKEEEIKLVERLNELDAEFQKKITHYQAIKQNFYQEIEIKGSRKCKQSQVLSRSQVSNKSSLVVRDDLNSRLMQEEISYSADQQYKHKPDEALTELMQRNQQLQQEIDEISATVEILLGMSESDKTINPELLLILREVKNILQPNPLGYSLIIN